VNISSEADGHLVIKISNITRRKLEKLGVFGQSWNVLLNDMADFIMDHEDEWFSEEEEEE
jgi:hypothetical protein